MPPFNPEHFADQLILDFETIKQRFGLLKNLSEEQAKEVAKKFIDRKVDIKGVPDFIENMGIGLLVEIFAHVLMKQFGKKEITCPFCGEKIKT